VAFLSAIPTEATIASTTGWAIASKMAGYEYFLVDIIKNKLKVNILSPHFLHSTPSAERGSGHSLELCPDFLRNISFQTLWYKIMLKG
jgi:hypothetical protein